MKKIILCLFVLGLFSIANAADRYAVNNGNYNSTTTWSTTPTGPSGASVPAFNDNVYTNGRQVTVNVNSFASHVFVSNDVDSSIIINSNRNLQIYGTLVSWDDTVGTETAPETQVIIFTDNTSRLVFRGSRVGSYSPDVVHNWNQNSVMGRLDFNMGSSTRNIVGDIDFSDALVRVQNGTAVFENDIDGGSDSDIDVLSGSGIVFNETVSNFDAYVFANGSSATFDASSAQNIPNSTYGDLTLDGSGTITKTLVGTGDFSVLGDFTINSSDITFDSDNASSITIGGDILIDGTWSPADLLTLNGTSAQDISGTGTLNCSGLTISNTTGVSNNITINLSGVLNLGSNGVFDADGSGSGDFTVTSSSLSNSGSIAELTPANFTGDITVQRFLDGPGAWRYIAMPITNANLGQLQSSFPITGNFSNPSSIGSNNVTCDTCTSVYIWNASNQAYQTVGSGAATGSTNLSNTVGYSMYTYMTNDITYEVTGSPSKGNVVIPVNSNGDGYNLIPNPYPSPIDWDDVTTTGTTNTVYMTTAHGGSFATYVKGGGAGSCTGCSGFNSNWAGEMAMGQAFWTESTGATTITITESAKTSSADFVRASNTSPSHGYRIRLAVERLSNGQYDDMLIIFNNNATDGRDIGMDGTKLANSNYVNLSSFMDSATVHYAINSIPEVVDLYTPKTVNLKLANTPNGNYKLHFKELNNFLLNYVIVLKDNYLNKSYKIKKGYSHDFQVDSNPSSTGNDRFDLVFYKPGKRIGEASITSNDETFISVFPNPSRNSINVNFESEDLRYIERIQLTDFNGRVYFELNSKEINSSNKINISSLKNGIYVLKILEKGNERNIKVYKQ